MTDKEMLAWAMHELMHGPKNEDSDYICPNRTLYSAHASLILRYLEEKGWKLIQEEDNTCVTLNKVS